jgi:hypothetical protein
MRSSEQVAESLFAAMVELVSQLSIEEEDAWFLPPLPPRRPI